VHARVDDLQRRDLVSAARELIHQKNFDTDSAAVERLLKVQSLVPTSVSNHVWSKLSSLTFPTAERLLS
jgi:negative regulator of replication initiation